MVVKGTEIWGYVFIDGKGKKEWVGPECLDLPRDTPVEGGVITDLNYSELCEEGKLYLCDRCGKEIGPVTAE